MERKRFYLHGLSTFVPRSFVVALPCRLWFWFFSEEADVLAHGKNAWSCDERQRSL